MTSLWAKVTYINNWWAGAQVYSGVLGKVIMQTSLRDLPQYREAHTVIGHVRIEPKWAHSGLLRSCEISYCWHARLRFRAVQECIFFFSTVTTLSTIRWSFLFYFYSFANLSKAIDPSVKNEQILNDKMALRDDAVSKDYSCFLQAKS